MKSLFADRINKKVKGESPDDGLVLGRQLAIEYYKCSPNALTRADRVEASLIKAANESNARIVSSSFHKFSPQGVSGVVVIAQSHFTIHAWPEHDYAAVDIFVCDDCIDLETAVNSMQASFGAENVVISSDLNRGIVPRAVEHRDLGEMIENPDISPISWEKTYKQTTPWGVSTLVDIYTSDPELISSPAEIEKFACDTGCQLGCKRLGKCRIMPFVNDHGFEGVTMTQLFETAALSGYFVSGAESVYLDLFSCTFYEPREFAACATAFFKGRSYRMQMSVRQ